jgi:hypothetical protein
VEQVSRTFGLHSEKEVYTHFTTKNPIKDQDSSLAFFPHRGEAALEEMEVEVGMVVRPEADSGAVAEETGNQAPFYV